MNAPLKSGQWRLLLLFLVAALPVLVAMVMYFGDLGIPAGRTNHGQLLGEILTPEQHALSQPLQAEDARLKQKTGQARWMILVHGVDDYGRCAAVCTDSLYITRQVNVALGRDADRVGRALLHASNPDAAAIVDAVLQKDPMLFDIPLDPLAVQQLQKDLSRQGIAMQVGDLLLMDPLGNIFMHYSQDTSGKGLLEDLKRVLKVSKIG